MVEPMTDASKNYRKLAAGALAVVLTLGAAGAAVAVNLASADSGQSSPAGQLTAVRDTTAGTTPGVALSTPTPPDTDPSGTDPSGAGSSTIARSDDDHGEGQDDEDHDEGRGDDDHGDHDEHERVERGHDDDD